MTKITPNTLAILKNFAGINKNLLVKKGNTLTTISEANSILAHATIDEPFEQDFGIYDLTEFLEAYALLNDPTLAFDASSLTLSEGRAKIHYRFANESSLTYPQKKITMPKADLTVSITNEDLNQIRKGAAVLGHGMVSVKSKGDDVTLSVIDPKNATANSFEIILEGVKANATFDLQFLISNLKLIPGDYTVDISSRFISHWKHKTEAVEYHIALEKTSSYK